jgi:hypothetical protein
MTDVLDDDAPVAVVVSNPFGSAPATAGPREFSTEVGAQRVTAEIQAAVVVAHKFPRNQIQAMDRILMACTRPKLAESALYNYSRGGTEISGPSIRLAEALAQNWGNIRFGVHEVERRAYAGRPGESTMEAYAWDLETNVHGERRFEVKHVRQSRERTTELTENRDVDEATANLGARRLRACILAIIPGDVVEAAVEQCERTLQTKANTSPEAVAKLVEAFEKFGVTREMIETRIQRRIDTIRPAQIVQLRRTWTSLNDGMSVASDWFQISNQEAAAQSQAATQEKGNAALKSRLRRPARQPARVPDHGAELGNVGQDQAEREPGEEG